MEKDEVQVKAATATRWSTVTEAIAKLVSPITNMILARLLTPEMFGVVATITMVISFADMFTDAGFQKFLIQHEFKDRKELDENTTVAFWTNLAISLFCWLIIAIFSENIADLVGNPGLGNVITIAAISLPLTSFSSIQMARYKRDLDFKTLFYVRLVGICIPLFVTVPIAFVTHSYWALVIGTIAGNLANAVLLTIRSQWKPSLYYSFNQLKHMFMFSWWILLESISIWLTSYIGTFIVGRYLSDYYLGIYKTSMTTVNQIISLITASTSDPLLSALSKLQNNEEEFQKVYLKYMKAIGVLVIPMGIGIFLYKDLITRILLGSQWGEAANFIGLWGLLSSISLVFGSYCSGVYNAKGKPFYSLLAQLLYLAVLVPAILYGASHGYDALYIARSVVRIEFIVVQMLIMRIAFGFKMSHLVKVTIPSFICSGIMCLVSFGLSRVSSSFLWQILSVVVCIVVYFGTMQLLFKGTVSETFNTLGFNIRDLIGKFIRKKKIVADK